MPVEKSHIYLLFWAMLGFIIVAIGVSLMAMVGRIPIPEGYERGMAGLALLIAGVGMLAGIAMGWKSRSVK